MTLYNGMSAEELEAQYNLIQRRGPDFPQLVERWLARSAAHRKNANALVDQTYGEGEREKFDYFFGGNKTGPVVFYIHGGYWQRGDKNMYSFVSEAFIQHGVSVVMLNYNLTPSVRIGEIAPQIRKAIAWCWHHSGDLGFSKEKITVMGHSAGGHLTAMMMSTNWPEFDAALPKDLVQSGIPISALFELEPLVHTSLNEGPQMDIAEAREESPIFIPPVTNAPQLIVVGGAESGEFFRQADHYVATYRTAERKLDRYDVPGMDHFDELEPLADDQSEFFHKSMELIQS